MGFRGEVGDVGADVGRVGGDFVPGYWGEGFEGVLEGSHKVLFGRMVI